MNLEAAAESARGLMDAHGLKTWTFRFDRGVRRFGACHYDDRAISLSARLTRLNDAVTVEDVVLHEVAHALAGPGAGHGPVWRRIAKELGVRPRRGKHALDITVPVPRYVGACPSCGAEVRRHRRDATACKRCCDANNDGRFTRRYLLVWSAR